MILIFFQILILILISDFVTGVFHWFEDVYGNPDWEFFGKAVVIPNLKHHKNPRGFLKGTIWNRVNSSLIATIPLGIIFHYFDILNWQLTFCLFYITMANEIHAMAHRTDKENGKIICALQKTGLIQSRKTHGLHHTSPFDINYCIQTDYLNPILNKIGFWKKMEYFLSLFGMKSTRGNLNRGGF